MAPSLSERLVNRLAGLGSKRASRRGFLTAATLTGTALAVNPWDYITKPQDAYASVCGPGATCGAGWSAMCCSINSGKNTCPPNTYAGGWWKADRSSFCGGSARYYIDCNAKPGHHFTCRCNKSNCDHRYVACNIFRYGQCNTQVKGVTAVVCRQISCRPPWELYPGKCGRSSATDNNTRAHNAPCLTKANTYPRLVTFPKAAHTEMFSGHSLSSGGRLTSHDRHTELTMQTNGNLVLRNQRGVIWQTRTNSPGSRLYLSSVSGRLYVIDKSGHVRWQTVTAKRSRRTVLKLFNAGYLAVYRGDKVIWRTHTHTP